MSGQKIYAKGLSNTKGTTGDGSLYKSDNLLTAFDKLITTLKTVVEGVRSYGDNESNAEGWKKEFDKVKALIDEAGIIATS